MNKNYNALGSSRDTMSKMENQAADHASGSLKVRWLLSVFAVICMFAGFKANAQVTVTGETNTTPAMSTSYGSLAAAIADVNNRTAISGPVTITLTASETAPAGGYLINNTGITGGSTTNRFIFNGGGNTLTAASPAGTSGALNDGMIKIAGTDFITIQNFVINENVANTTTAAASNNMMEWGIAVLYSGSTNGSQDVILQNNTITLNRTYQNTFGIYSNSTHTLAAPTTSATATTAAGGNSNLKIYGNNISNVNNGIIVVGPTAAADANAGIEIGGAGLGNTITNYGTTGTFSGYANVSGTVNGILIRNSNGYVVSNNTVTSSVGGVTVGTLNGIQQPASSNTPTGTFTNNINSNIISLRSGLANGAMNGINVVSGSATATSSININGNDFNNFGHTVAGTGVITFIFDASLHLNTNVNNNTFTNMSVNTTGNVLFINLSNTINTPATGTKNVNGNSIVGTFAKTGAGGTVTLFTDAASAVCTSPVQNNNNNFSNITLTGATVMAGWFNNDGTGATPPKQINGNTFSNWTTGVANMNALQSGFGGNISMSNNTITNLSGGAQIVGISQGSNGTIASTTIENNTVTGLSSTGAATNVFGILSTHPSTVTNVNNNTVRGLSAVASVAAIQHTGAAPTGNFMKNTVADIAGSGASSQVFGMAVTALTTTGNFSNNRIGDLRAPAANVASSVFGMSLSGTAAATLNVAYNTVNIAGSSSGAVFGTSAISVNTTPTINMNNNVFVNTSTANGAGLAVAYRRSSATLTTHGATSDRNDFVASTIYTDGTTPQATLAAYKTLVGPTRDANSINANPAFLSTVSGNADFLKINPAVATQLESSAANIAGIVDDFEGTVRQGNPGYLTQVNGGGTAPDMGADEFDGIPAPVCNGTPAAATINGAAAVCPNTGTTLSLSTTYTDLGISYAWFSGTTPGGPYPTALGTAITQATGNLAVDTYYIAQITCANSGLTYTTAEKAVTIGALPAAVIASGGGTFCSSTMITAANGGDGTIYFQGTTSGGTSTATASSSQTVTVSGTYYFRAQSALGCWGPEGSVTVTIDQPAGITVTPASICQGASGTIEAVSAVNCLSYVASGTSISGAWTNASPSANRPASSDNSATCSFSAATPRNYDTKSFQVSVAGTYSFKMTFNTNYDGMGYLVSGAFVPGSCATGTFIKGDDDENGATDNEPLFTANLVPGVTYTLVSTNWDIVTLVDTYAWTITPPAGGQFMLPVNGNIEWYTAASGGTAIGTGSPFNPVGVAGSGLADTNTPGTTTYYAACSSSSSCRTAVNFVINPSTTNPTSTITSCGPYTWPHNGQVYNTSGTYTEVVNCVTETLVLTVSPIVAHNTNTSMNFCSIQAAINDAATLNGHTITIEPGTYNEQVLVNKSLTITSVSTQPTIDFTGTVTGKPTLFDVSADNVTINNIHFNVDLSKLKSAIIASGAAIDNIVVTNNVIDAYGTPSAGTYGDRNAVSVNYGGPTNYRVASGGVNNITYTGNTVNGTMPASFFRSGIAADEAGGTFSGNTLQSINHDVIVRFGSNGNINITGNNFNGGGVELVDMNAGAGILTVSNNNFNAAFANSSAPGSAVLRLQNNYNAKTTNVSNNNFTNHQWAVMLANYNTVNLDNNTFTPLAGSTTFHHVAVTTKGVSTNSASVVQVSNGASFTNNTFNGSGSFGGTSLSFHNHDNDNASFGTFTIGTAGNENNFSDGVANNIYLDHQSGTSSGSTFPAYTTLIGSGAPALTTMSAWSVNLDATNNRFDVSGGLQLPSAMSQTALFAAEDRIQHAIDATGLGFVTVKANNAYVTTNSFVAPLSTTPAIARGIAAAATGHTVNVSPGTFIEDVVVNKQLIVLGSGMGVTTVSGPIGGGGSTFQILASNPVIEGFTITREGNNTTDWNNPGLNTAGVSVQGLTVSGEVRYCEITGMRTGIDINNSNGNNIHNNNIHFNRTGMILRNQTDNTIVENNFITDNWTAGILFLDASGGSNVPVQSAADSSFSDNNISGNWYAQVVDRQSGGSLPAPGANLKNFSCNWYGSTAPVVTTANSAEPGYAAQIPVMYGGTAAAPGGQPDIAGPASANIAYTPLAVSGTDLGGITTDGWQPSAPCAAPCDLVVTATPTAIVCNGGTSTVTVTATGGSGNYTGTGTFTVPAGTYTYTVTDLNGCVDSDTITISEPPVSAGTTTITACDSYTWTGPLGDGQTYTASGTYTNVTTNGSGCQHTETLVLTINNSTTDGSMTVTNAGPYTWAGPLGSGLTYNTSGVYTHVTTNAAGCPNTATLTLTVTPVNSFVIGTSCGATISGLSVTIVAPVVSGATTYTFRIVNTVTNSVLVVNRPVNSLALSNYAGITLGTQYTIQVSTNGGATYGPPCTIITPSPTSTIGAQCGTTLTSMGQFVYATYAPSVTGYRFRVTNTATSAVQVYDALSGQNRFSFNQLPAAFAQFSTIYSVEVALRNTDGTYLPYGAACNITTPAFPTSEVVLSQCDYTATSYTQMINAVAVSGATGYRFQLVNSTLSYNFSIDRSLASFNLSMFPGIVDGVTYTVRVAVRIGGVWGPLNGKPCNLTAPGTLPDNWDGNNEGGTIVRVTESANDFKAIAYPNPFAENFMFDVQTSAQGLIQVRVYDMLGKQVENRNVETAQINNIQFGDAYPSGVYNVVVSQGDHTQTLRVVKR